VGGEMTILEFARLVVRLAGSASEIHFIAPQDERTKDDPHSRQPDITRARTILGWEPRVPLEEGLARTIAWFRERM